MRDLVQEDTSGIFAPDFRKALNKARREQARRRRLAGQAEPPLVEELYREAGYATVRIGDSCWKVPTDAGPNDRETRIWMVDYGCPKPRKRLFSRQ